MLHATCTPVQAAPPEGRGPRDPAVASSAAAVTLLVYTSAFKARGLAAGQADERNYKIGLWCVLGVPYARLCAIRGDEVLVCVKVYACGFVLHGSIALILISIVTGHFMEGSTRSELKVDSNSLCCCAYDIVVVLALDNGLEGVRCRTR